MDLKKELNDINTPTQLLEFMSKYINYGYLGKSGKVYQIDDAEFNDKWSEEYVLESKDDILSTLHGNCWDQVELQRYWFESKGYEVKTIYEMVKLDYNNDYPTHSFLIFKDKDNSWNWFENADQKNRGIHKFSTINEVLSYQYASYLQHLKTFNITNEELAKVILTEFNKPLSNISASEYLDFVINSRQIYINKERENFIFS